MENDEELYSEAELSGIGEWHQLEHPDLPSEPFKFYFAKFKSGSPEAQELFMDPRSALRGNVESLAALPGVDEETRITTTIFGHHRTLKLRLIICVAAVDAQDNSVSLTSHKSIGTS